MPGGLLCQLMRLLRPLCVSGIFRDSTLSCHRPPSLRSFTRKMAAGYHRRAWRKRADQGGHQARATSEPKRSPSILSKNMLIPQADQGDRAEELDRLERLADKLSSRLEDGDVSKLYRQLMKFMSRKEVGAMEVAEWWRKIFADAFTYVHGRQPTSIEIAERKDAVLIIPGINAPTDVSQADLAAAIERRGLAALDFEGMKLVDDAEFDDVVEEGEG